jgi:hypothetical protein
MVLTSTLFSTVSISGAQNGRALVGHESQLLWLLDWAGSYSLDHQGPSWDVPGKALGPATWKEAYSGMFRAITRCLVLRSRQRQLLESCMFRKHWSSGKFHRQSPRAAQPICEGAKC